MRPVLILAIFLINFAGLKGETTEISEMTDEGVSTNGMEWRQHENANTHESKDTMEVTRRSFWQSITRKFQEWESTSMSYLEKDRPISPEDTTNISTNMMDNARGMSHPQMHQSEEFDLTTHVPNDMMEKAQGSWQNRTRNVQQWSNASRSHLERNVSSEEMSMDGRYHESTKATAYGHENQMRYLQNGTYEKEHSTEVFFRSPNYVSMYQYDRWANDTLSVGYMNVSVRYYSEQVTRSPEWFQNNTMNIWENKTRQHLVTMGYFSNGSSSDIAPQTFQMWNMSIRDVNTYPETRSNTTSMGSIEINTTGQIQTAVSRDTVNTKMYSYNSHMSQVDIWNMTASTTSGYGIPKVNSQSTINDTSAHSSETFGVMNDTAMNDGSFAMNESLTIRFENETSGGMNDTAMNDGNSVMNESHTIRFENETFGVMNDTAMNDGNSVMNESHTIRFENETFGVMNDTAMNDGNSVMNESHTIRFENETFGVMNDTAMNDGNSVMNESHIIRFENETFGVMNDTAMNDGNSVMNESHIIRLENETSGGMNDTSMNDGNLVMNESHIIRLENETSEGMNDTYVTDGSLGMNENLTIQLEIWNVIGSPPSTTSTPVVTHNSSESMINDTSAHRNRTRLCLTKNNLTKDCIAADSGE